MTEYTHKIVAIERAATKNSGSPMWRCVSDDGQRVNVFRHDEPARNTLQLMLDAGYVDVIGMTLNEKQNWTQHPIAVRLIKDGQWWSLAAVAPRPAGAHPDADWTPNISLFQERAQRHAKRLTFRRESEVVYIDSESTGLLDDDEMVSFAIVQPSEGVLFDSRIQCAHPEKLLRLIDGKCPADVNGIRPEDLATAMPLQAALAAITYNLYDRMWVGWNIEFDVALLERECLNANHHLPFSLGIHDAMDIFAHYAGAWQPQYRSFKRFKLGDAVAMLGIDSGYLHNAKSDAMATLEVLRAVGEGKPLVSLVETVS